jgi:hypothetical protein
MKPRFAPALLAALIGLLTGMSPAEAEHLEAASDEQGRTWVQIAGYDEGNDRVWGWVIREFISCYNR